MNKALLGIIGGMGTQASACFYEKLHSMQNVVVEQDYIDILLYSIPSIPDRTAFITGKSTENPLDSLISAARTLETAGVSRIAIPCITSHYFYDKLSEAVSIPILNLLDETAFAVSERNAKNICLFATDGTIKGKVFDSAFEKCGINVILPADDVQSNLMELIYNIKCGTEFSTDTLNDITSKALEEGAETVVLGCTELCVAAKSSPKVINVLDILAEAALR